MMTTRGCLTKRSVCMGRKPKLTIHQRQKALLRRDAGESLTAIARSYNVSHSTISRRISLIAPEHRRSSMPSANGALSLSICLVMAPTTALSCSPKLPLGTS
jgi:hypothetical protein